MAVIDTPMGTFDFKSYDMKEAQWNDRPGVYMFVMEMHGENKVLYVGLCESFKTRFSTHERWEEASRRGANSVHAVVLDDTATRQALERYLIQELSPPMNTHHVTELTREFLRR